VGREESLPTNVYRRNMMTQANQKKIYDIYESTEINPLQSMEEIEDLIVAIDSLDKRESFYKSLKKKRTQAIDTEIEKIEKRRERLKEVIKTTLKENKQKSLNFPGIGRVSFREVKGSWNVIDEEAVVEQLSSILDPNDFKEVVKTESKIVKKNLNKVLESLESKNVSLNGVEKEPARSSVTVSINDGLESEIEEEEVEAYTSDDNDKLEL